MLKFYKSTFFPIKKSKNKLYKYEALVGFGANVGDSIKRFDKVFRYWQNDKRVHVVKTSLILKNPPFGYLLQDDFFNAVALVQTSLSAKKFLYFLQHSEKVFKRQRSFKNAPRTLDLDIIMFSNYESKHVKLSVPHPFWKQRISVLAPLMKLMERNED